MLLPSEKRFKKVSKISIWIVFLTFIIFSFVVYSCLGDENTPPLVIIRKPYLDSLHPVEIGYMVILILYILINQISMSVFNFTLKTFLLKTFNLPDSGASGILASIGPYLLAILIGALYPNIIDVLGLISLIINNFNGFIIPALLWIGIYKKEVNK